MIHLIYGYGRGKTTCSAGLALRNAGKGGRVLFAQFLKNVPSGEALMFEKTDSVDVILAHDAKFSWEMHGNDKEKLCLDSMRLIETVLEKYHSGTYTMIVLDEILNTVCGGLVSEDCIVKLFSEIKCELVLTGLKATEKLIATADYVTEIVSVKHPYEKGVSAREGIEF